MSDRATKNENKNNNENLAVPEVEMHGNYNSNKNNPMDDGSHTPPRSYIDEELLKPLCIATFITNRPCFLCWLIVILMFCQ